MTNNGTPARVGDVVTLERDGRAVVLVLDKSDPLYRRVLGRLSARGIALVEPPQYLTYWLEGQPAPVRLAALALAARLRRAA